MHQKYSAHFDAAPDMTNALPFIGGRPGMKAQSRSYEYMKQRFSLLAQQWFGQLPYAETVCNGILMELLGIASREADVERFPSKSLALADAVQQYILEHYREPLKLDTLSRHVNRTPNHVTSVFRQIKGMTPVDYLHEVRVSAARDLLLNTRMTIAQTAEYLGYCDQSYFNKVYKRITGMPPSSLLSEKRAP
ncbi:helix-turn-helix domain-containing protein [Paenibacillus swuensis]